LIQFNSTTATNLRHLTSLSTTCCPQHRDQRLLWCHFCLCIDRKIDKFAFESHVHWTDISKLRHL